MALAQCMHFDASTALACLQNGQVLVGAAGAAGASLIIVFPIMNATNAITMKVMIVLTKVPQLIVTAAVSPAASFSVITSELKSTPPRRTPIGGMMMSFTSEPTTLPNPSAPPPGPALAPLGTACRTATSHQSRTSRRGGAGTSWSREDRHRIRTLARKRLPRGQFASIDGQAPADLDGQPVRRVVAANRHQSDTVHGHQGCMRPAGPASSGAPARGTMSRPHPPSQRSLHCHDY